LLAAFTHLSCLWACGCRSEKLNKVPLAAPRCRRPLLLLLHLFLLLLRGMLTIAWFCCSCCILRCAGLRLRQRPDSCLERLRKGTEVC
jgi:hypothetical protein